MTPTTICNEGRSEEDFAKDGTGYVLYIQSGPTPAGLDTSPLSEPEAEKRVRFSWDIVYDEGFIYAWKIYTVIFVLNLDPFQILAWMVQA